MVVVIVGPTASGKTGVAIEIAKELDRLSGMAGEEAKGMVLAGKGDSKAVMLDKKDDVCYNGGNNSSNEGAICSGGKVGYEGAEIISADSRAIYRGMDIGTAKPSLEEQQGVKHWGIDLVNPRERFTVADWKKYTQEKIAEIQKRGNLPMVVGGTGLYIDALVYDYQFGDENKRLQTDREELNKDFILFGIKWSSDDLRKRITQRADKLFTQELLEETKKLVQEYGWGSQAMKSNIYQFAWGYLQGEYSLEKAKELFVYDDWHLAKRQMTWFKRNKNINWLSLDEIRDNVVKCIQDE